MRIIIISGTKLLFGQNWLTNELDLLNHNKIKFLIPYVALIRVSDPRYNCRKYKGRFLYIPRCMFSFKEIVYLFQLQIKTFIKYPLQYVKTFLRSLSLIEFQSFLNFLKLTKILSQVKYFNPDIIYVHYPNNTFLIAYFAGIFLSKKVGIVCHAVYDYPNYISKIIHNAAFILVKSEEIRTFLLGKQSLITNKVITVLPWGIDTKFFSPIRKFIDYAQKDSKDSGQISIVSILSISRFVEMKGLIYLLQACKLLANENVKFKCILVGYGPLKSSYQRYIATNKLNKYIKIYSPIPHSTKLKKMLAGADVFVLPAIIDKKTGERDFIPNAVLEAMAMEKVVITTKVTDMQEVAKDGESIFFAKEKDSVDLAKKIRMVMDLSEDRKKEIGKKAREIVVKYYDKETQGKKFVEFLKAQVQNDEK